jgi:hypothetical protein
MTPEDLERANHRLAGTESFTVTPAKYLGHYVTGVLAARHGIKVQLQGSVVVGIAAMVDLPPTLLADRAGRATALAAMPAPAAAASGPPAASPWESEGPADDRGYDEGPIERPTAEDVRAAVALIRSRSATSSRRPDAPAAGPAPAAPAAGTVPPSPAAALAGGYRPALAELGPAAPRPPQYVRATLVPPAPGPAPPSPPPAPAVIAGAGGASNLERPRFEPPRAWGPVPAAPDMSAPERTASGLVRRVRGSSGPTPGTAGGAPRSPWVTPRAPGTPAVDGAEMQRFLTNLARGVQRSLDQQASGAAGGDER